MKILSQLMNAVPDATGKLNTADAGKGDLQSSFSAVIGAAVVAAAGNGDARLAKAQNVETKKTSSPESGKKSASSGDTGTSNAVPAVHESVPVSVVVPVVPQVVIPQVKSQQGDSSAKESVVAADTNSGAEPKSSMEKAISTISGTGLQDVVKGGVPALPTVAATSDKSATESSNQVAAAKAELVAAATVEATSVATATPTVASVAVSNAPIAAAVASAAKAVPATISNQGGDHAVASKISVSDLTSNGAVKTSSVSTPAPVVSGVQQSSPINAKPAATDGQQNAPVSSSVAAVREIMAQQLPIPTAAQAAAPEAVSAPVSQSTNPVASAAKTNGSQDLKPGSVNAAPVAKSGVVASVAPKVEFVTVNAPQGQSNIAAKLPTVSATSQPQAATSQSEPVAVAAPKAVESAVPASAPQAATVAVAVEQQAIPQQAVVPTSVDAAAAPSNVTATASNVAAISSIPAVASNVSAISSNVAAVSSSPAVASNSDAVASNVAAVKAPAVKGEPVSGAKSPVVSKARTAADWRLNRNFAVSDEKASSSDSDNAATPVTKVAGNETVPGEVVSNIKGIVETAVQAQTAQSAQASGQAVSAPVASAPATATQDAGAATALNLPATATAVESTQAGHALNSAQLIQSVHGSEMRLGMQSAEFGNISISTTLNHQALSAQISIDHSALGHALAMHLPAIEEKLGSAYGLQAKVELRDAASNSAASDSSSSSGSRGDGRPQGGGTGTSSAVLQNPVSALSSSNFTSSSTTMAATTSRLDIRI